LFALGFRSLVAVPVRLLIRKPRLSVWEAPFKARNLVWVDGILRGFRDAMMGFLKPR